MNPYIIHNKIHAFDYKKTKEDIAFRKAKKMRKQKYKQKYKKINLQDYKDKLILEDIYSHLDF